MKVEIVRTDNMLLHPMLESVLVTSEEVSFYSDFNDERIYFEITKGETKYIFRVPPSWNPMLTHARNYIMATKEGPLGLVKPLSEIAKYWITKIRELEEAENIL